MKSHIPLCGYTVNKLLFIIYLCYCNSTLKGWAVSLICLFTAFPNKKKVENRKTIFHEL